MHSFVSICRIRGRRSEALAEERADVPVFARFGERHAEMRAA